LLLACALSSRPHFLFFFCRLPPRPLSPLFPYTALFRSPHRACAPNRRRRRRRALWHRTARWCPTAVAAPPDRAGSPRYRCRTPRSWCPWPSHPGRRRSRRPGSVRRVPRRSPDPASTRCSTPRGPVPARPHRTGTTATLPWQDGGWCSWHDFTLPAQPHGTTWHLAPRAGGYGMGVSIRLIATDLDGTLLTDPTTISPRNLAALDAARAFGMEVVP